LAVGGKGIPVTIYSQHANRGKTQILATFTGASGITSTTVTSVDDAALAAPIVDALNRVSACATVPVSIHYSRGGHVRQYPWEHLAVLADRGRREELLTGAYSLWYEYAKAMLYQALNDLDAALAAVAPPVRTAIEAELGAEARDLYAGLHMYSVGSGADEPEPERKWEFGAPFVLFDGGIAGLSSDTRQALNKLEEGLSPDEVSETVGDLRVLYEASLAPARGDTLLDESILLLSHEPRDDQYYLDQYYLEVTAPVPGDQWRDAWEVSVWQWDTDLNDPATAGETIAGESVLDCTLPSRPAATDLVNLLTRSEASPDQLATWAKTPVGQFLDGTPFTVTKRYDD
jgi:hypothetical protein